MAQKLAENLPPPLKKSYFDCSGSHINDVELRLAKFVTGRFEVIALLHGYHGSTQGTQNVTGHGHTYRERYGPSHSNITFIPVPYPYRCQDHGTPEGCADWCLRFTEEILDWGTTGRPAALIMEPIPRAGGVIVLPKEWHQGLRRICEERGIIQIFDECHSGLGRTGRWFAFEHFDVVPDIVAIGKGLGELPLSAAIVSEQIAAQAEELGFAQSSSHSGDPLLCAGGMAATNMGVFIKGRLQSLAERYDIIGDLRGHGLMLGIEIVTDRETKEPGGDIAEAIVNECMERGLLLFYRPGPRYAIEPGHLIRLSPPIVIAEGQVDEAMTIFEEVIESVANSHGNDASPGGGDRYPDHPDPEIRIHVLRIRGRRRR